MPEYPHPCKQELFISLYKSNLADHMLILIKKLH